MSVRVLFILSVLAVLYGCGQASLPTERQQQPAGTLEEQPAGTQKSAAEATTRPDTSITRGPAEGSTDTDGNVQFDFAGTDNVGVSSFECSLVSAGSADSFSACTPPKAYTLTNKSYTFKVRAKDAAGNTDASPSVVNFSVTAKRVNVRDFGATGNDTSNDSAAFENAMAAAGAGEMVFVPAPGNYRIAGVNIPSNTTLQVESGAALKKYGAVNGPLFDVQGPNNTTFANNIHIEGVSGNFTMDLNDAGQKTAGISYRNVRNFSLKNMVCIQNNDNQTQEAPSSRRPCLYFQASTSTPTNGVYNHPTDGTFENVHSKQSPYGWGLIQITGGENLRFLDISSEGGVPLRVENYSSGWTRMDNIFADGVKCKNGHDAVHYNPHGATHGTITVRNVVAQSCESALSIAGDGSYAVDSSVDDVTVLPGDQAQLRDDVRTGYPGAWVVGPSRWCVDYRATTYTINFSKVDCGDLANN